VANKTGVPTIKTPDTVHAATGRLSRTAILNIVALIAPLMFLLSIFIPARIIAATVDGLPQTNQQSANNVLSSVSNAPPQAKLIEAATASQDKLLPPSGNDAITEFWQSRSEPGTRGGSFTVSTFGTGTKTFNLWSSTEAESHGISELLYEDLVDIDPWTGATKPKLAKSVSISPDNLEYTFVLRKGLQGSDGQPLTADDVVFTFDKIIKEGFGNSSLRDVLSVEDKFPAVTKVDALTVKFRTVKPFAPFLSNLRGLGVAPKHALEKYTVGKDAHDKFHAVWDINCNPNEVVCSGPFKLARYVPSQRVELVRNPRYAVCDANNVRLPYLDKFTVVIVPDQNAELVKFYGRELDMLDVRQVRGSDAALMKQREKTGNFKLYNLGPNDGRTFLMLNMNRRVNPKTKKPYVDPIKQKWFNDLNFRQAVNHAVNRKRIVNNAMRGVGFALYGPESPAALYINKKIQPFQQDLVYAQTLLEKSGFKKNRERLYDKDGNAVEFTLNTNAGNTTRDAICVAIQNDLKQLGMKVNYQPIDFNILVDKTNSACDWEAVVMALTGDKVEPYNGANTWKSNGRLHMFDQRLPGPDGKVVCTDARPWEKEIDRCFNEGSMTFDTAKRHEWFDRYQQIVYEQCPFIYLDTALDLSALSNKFGNYNPTPMAIYYNPKGSLHNVEEIYLRGGKH
jgi:peptide/nickel transport system substrate-binding protein